MAFETYIAVVPLFCCCSFFMTFNLFKLQEFSHLKTGNSSKESHYYRVVPITVIVNKTNSWHGLVRPSHRVNQIFLVTLYVKYFAYTLRVLH